jgi:dolichol kinase/phosphoserine phosphatase
VEPLGRDNSLSVPRPHKEPKLVVFDVEGVIIPRNRFFFELGKELGFSKLVKVLFFGFLYEIGVIRLKSALKHIFGSMKGVKMGYLLQIAGKIPIMPSAREVFDKLKASACKTALVSSGLPQAIVSNLAKELGADSAFGFEIGLNDDALTGEIWGDVIEKGGKLRILSHILKVEELSLSDCVVVADDRNNAAIYLPEIRKIGYNPDFVIRVKADHVVTGKLSKVLPVINGKSSRPIMPSMNDFRREIIHASGALIPVLSVFFGLIPTVVMICSVVGVYVVSELARMNGKNLPVISTITRYAASQSELYEFATAPIYFAVGILIALLLFRAPASSAAIAIFAVGDSTASIFGGLFSKTPLPFNKGKTLEGSISGFFFAFLAGAIFVSPLIALVGSAVAMLVEYLPLPVNDNILVPLFTGIALAFMI